MFCGVTSSGRMAAGLHGNEVSFVGRIPDRLIFTDLNAAAREHFPQVV